MHSETSSTAHHTNAVRAQQGQPIRARSPASHRGSQKQRNATFPHKHTPNKDLNMTRSKRHSPCACHQREGMASHTAVRGSRCKPQAGKVSDQKHHKITLTTTHAFRNKQYNARDSYSARTTRPSNRFAPAPRSPGGSESSGCPQARANTLSI